MSVAATSPELEDRIRREVEAQLAERLPARRGLAVIAFSGDMDRLLAVLTLANTAAASGRPATVFFTFWGVCALKRRTVLRGKSLAARLLSLMLPRGPQALPTSRLNLAGAGPLFFRWLMRREQVAELPAMLETARSLGVRLVACSTSMELMGIRPDELLEGVAVVGAPSCLQTLVQAEASLFV